MSDVWLSYFKDWKEHVLLLRSGDKLNYQNGCLVTHQGNPIAYLSKAMLERLKNLADMGYDVVDAEVSYIVAWRPRENPQEIAVCLANLTLERIASVRSSLSE